MKSVLVTGASGGIGGAVCRRFAADGYTVFGLDLKEAEPTDGVTFIRADLRDGGSVRAAAEAVRAKGAALDCIIHTAGVYELDSLFEIGEDAWRRIFDVNLTAVYLVNREFLPLLCPGGKIIITTSELAPLYPLPFTGIYAVSKAALDRYADALRMEAGLIGHPVVVLRPGAVDTGMLPVSTQKLAEFCENTKLYSVGAEKFRRIVDRVESKKIPPERVADLVLRIARKKKPRASYSINRNPGLLLLNALPKRLQRAIIKRLLK